jgi:hypothetical protein
MAAGKEGNGRKEELANDSDFGIDDAATIPRGALDPVYEAKARVLNRAVGVGEALECPRS